MSIPTHEEPWLRDEFEGLLGTEPETRATVQDDVRRGERARAVRRRRRTVALTVSALMIAIGVPLGLTLRPAAPSVQVAPAPTSPSIDPAASFARMQSVLRGLGFEIATSFDGEVGFADNSSNVDYTLRRIGSDVVTYRMRTHVRPPWSGDPGAEFSWFVDCAAEECAPVEMRSYDCASASSCPGMASTMTSKPSRGLPANTLLVALHYAGGAVVEGAFTPGDCETCSLPNEDPFVDVDQARAVLLALGEPPAPAPRPSRTMTYVPYDQWDEYVRGLLPAGAYERTVEVMARPGNARTLVMRVALQGTHSVLGVQIEEGSGSGTPPPSGCQPGDACVVEIPWSSQDGVWREVVLRTGAGPDGLSYQWRVASVLRGRWLVRATSDARDPGATDGNDFTVTGAAPPLIDKQLLVLAGRVPVPDSDRAGYLAQE